MSHLTDTRWHGYATEPRRVEILVTSELSSSDITSAELRISGQDAVTLTASSAAGGYLLTADEVELPAAGVYRWAAEVTDDEGHTPIVVAGGTLSVSPRVSVAAA